MFIILLTLKDIKKQKVDKGEKVGQEGVKKDQTQEREAREQGNDNVDSECQHLLMVQTPTSFPSYLSLSYMYKTPRTVPDLSLVLDNY